MDPSENVDPFKKGGLRRSGIMTEVSADGSPMPVEPANPFARRGLRRSDVAPVAPAQEEDTEGQERAIEDAAEELVQEEANPFQKRGLRRSDMTAPGPAPTEEQEHEEEEPTQEIPANEIPIDEAPESPLDPFQRRGLRRSDPKQLTESMIAMPPPPRPSQQQDTTEEEEQPEPSIIEPSVHERTLAEQSTIQKSPEAASIILNEREAARKQRLRGAQTRSPGVGAADFAFDFPAVGAVAAAQAVLAPAVDSPGQPMMADSPATLPSRPGSAPRASVQQSPFGVQPQVNYTTGNEEEDLTERISFQQAAQEPSIIHKRSEQHSDPESSEEELTEARFPERPRTAESHLNLPLEPKLPPTPTQRGIPDPVVTTPPTGIHTSPSRRHQKRSLISSPLKPKDPPNIAPQSTSAAAPSSQKRGPLRGGSRVQVQAQQAQLEQQQPGRKRRRDEPLQRIVSADPNAAKRRKRDRMLAEIELLEADIALAGAENERVRQKGQAARAPQNTDAIIDLLARVVAPPKKFDDEKRKSVWSNINKFMPFSRTRRKQAPKTELLKPKGLPSVEPIEQADPLPYLRVFTPLSFESTITNLPPTPGVDSGEAEIRQQHTITTSSPSSLYTSKLSVIVNTTNLSISNITLHHIDPCAEDELGPWVRGRITDGLKHGLGNDVNSIFWAQGRWLEAALRRARFFCEVEAELATPEARKRVRRKFKAKEKGEEVGKEEERKWSSSELALRMRRRNWEVEIAGVVLCFRWCVALDWVGDVENDVECEVRCLRVCESRPTAALHE